VLKEPELLQPLKALEQEQEQEQVLEMEQVLQPREQRHKV
jgi:hypothetical protein